MNWDSDVKWRRLRNIKLPIHGICDIGNSRWVLEYLKKTKRLDEIKIASSQLVGCFWQVFRREKKKEKLGLNVLGGSRVFSFTQTSPLSIILHWLFPLLRSLRCHQGPEDCNTWYEWPVMCLPPSVSGFSGPGTELACISVCWTKEWIVVGKGFSQFSPIFHECNFLKTQSMCVLVWRGRDGKELPCPVGSGRVGGGS